VSENDPKTPLTRAERERLRRIHADATRSRNNQMSRPAVDAALAQVIADASEDTLRIMVEDYAAAIVRQALIVNALPRLLTALDAAESRAERAEGERDGMYEALGRLVALYEGEYDNEPPPARPAWLQDALGGEARKVAEARDAAHYDAVTREMTRREAAESALAALRAEVEGLRARLDLALLAVRIGFHAERFAVGDEGVTRYSCCGREYVCPDPFVNNHAKDCKAIQFATAAEAAAKKEGV